MDQVGKGAAVVLRGSWDLHGANGEGALVVFRAFMSGPAKVGMDQAGEGAVVVLRALMSGPAKVGMDQAGEGAAVVLRALMSEPAKTGMDQAGEGAVVVLRAVHNIERKAQPCVWLATQLHMRQQRHCWLPHAWWCSAVLHTSCHASWRQPPLYLETGPVSRRAAGVCMDQVGEGAVLWVQGSGSRVAGVCMDQVGEGDAGCVEAGAAGSLGRKPVI